MSVDEADQSGGQPERGSSPEPCPDPVEATADPVDDFSLAFDGQPWDVEEAWDLDPFADLDPAESGSDPEVAARQEMAGVLAVLDADLVVIAAKQSRAVVALGEMAVRWPCPHTDDVDTPEWAALSREWVHEGPSKGMNVGGVHAGFHGVCWESLEALATELAAHHPSWTLGWARTQILWGIQLPAVLPATLNAWSQGRLDARRVGVIIRGLDLVTDDDVARKVDQRLCGEGEGELDRTSRLTPRTLAARVGEVLAEVDAAAVADRSRTKAAARSMTVTDEGDGLASLTLTGPAPAVHEMAAVIRAAGQASKTEAQRAKRAGEPSRDPWAIPDLDGPHDGRGIDAHRFDAAHAIITAALTRAGATGTTGSSTAAAAGGGPDARPGQLTLPTFTGGGVDLVPGWSGGAHLPVVLVALSSLVGADGGPARLDGYGVVPTWMAIAMARHRRLRRFLTDPLTGALVHQDTHTYAPGTASGITITPDPPEPPEPPDRPEPPGDGPGGGGPGGGRGGGGSGGGASPTAAPTGGIGEGCVPVDPADCPVRIGGLAALAAGVVGAGVSGRWIPSTALAAFVRRAWGQCTMPGCTRPAAACDVDHTIRWPESTTCSCDLAPLCTRCHLVKHGSPLRGGGPAVAWAARSGSMPWKWSLWRCTAGHQHWTSPLGEQHVIAPPPPLADPRTPAPPALGALPALVYPSPPAPLPPRPPAPAQPNPMDAFNGPPSF